MKVGNMEIESVADLKKQLSTCTGPRATASRGVMLRDIR